MKPVLLAIVSLCLSTLALDEPDKKPEAPDFDKFFPAEKSVWKEDVVKEKGPAFKSYITALMSLPADKVTAHAAGADFPGVPPADASRETRSVSIDLSTAGMHSTGLYAAPGEKITVTIPDASIAEKLDVKIGCHQDQLWRVTTPWKRVPQITRQFPINAATVTAANAFGGLIYIVVKQPHADTKLDVKIANAVAAPWYVLDKTDLKEWRDKIRAEPAAFAELQSKHMVLSLQSSVVRALENPDELMRFWDKLVEAEDELAGKPSRPGPMRIVFDRQISAGYMHSGYPIMCPLNEAKNAASLDAMKKGTWGFYHEMGHNHQSGDWTFGGTVEVTCNLFSLYCLEKVCGLPRDGHPSIKPKPREQKMKNYFKDGGHFEDWKLDPFLALYMYMQMVDEFGWDPFKKVFAEYRDLPQGKHPKTDDEKHDQWLVRMSRATGKNLGPFFDAWKLPTSEAARKSVADLPEWMPEKDFPKKYMQP